MAKVEIYTQDWCPFCVRAKGLLDGKGVAYTEIHAPNGSAERAESNSRSGRTSVPQVFIDGSPVGGSDELAALERSGGLDKLLAA